MKYGLLKTSSINIGDEIQCIAASRFLPRIDTYVHREATRSFYDEDKVKVIMNHYWLHKPESFPPSDCIDPLYVSFHLKYTLRNDKFLNGDVYNHLKQHQPIGCRDIGTAKYLESRGIDAYLSGCLTTTLLPNINLKHKFIDDYILCVDVPDAAVEVIKKRTNKRVVEISRFQNAGHSTSERFEMAKFTLFLYHNAFCVVTIALHAAIPSTAFGTPVCVLNYADKERESRFEGLEDFFNMVEVNDFLSNETAYDINNPPSNPDEYSKYASQLTQRCRDFTGFDSCKSPFEDDYNPILDIAPIMKENYENYRKTLYFVKQKDLVKTFILRFFRRKDRHSF